MKLIFIRREFMPYYDSPCADEDIVEPICDACGEETEAGNVRSAILIKAAGLSGILAAPTTKAVYDTAVTAGNAFLIKATRGSFDGGTPAEVDGFGDQVTKVIGYDFVLTVKDPVYKSNRAFWNSIKGRTDLYVAFRTESQLHISESVVTVTPKNPIQEDSNSQVVWEIEIKWRQKALMNPIDSPATLFDCVYEPEYYTI